jgi:hypothetical protein
LKHGLVDGIGNYNGGHRGLNEGLSVGCEHGYQLIYCIRRNHGRSGDESCEGGDDARTGLRDDCFKEHCKD